MLISNKRKYQEALKACIVPLQPILVSIIILRLGWIVQHVLKSYLEENIIQGYWTYSSELRDALVAFLCFITVAFYDLHLKKQKISLSSKFYQPAVLLFFGSIATITVFYKLADFIRKFLFEDYLLTELYGHLIVMGLSMIYLIYIVSVHYEIKAPRAIFSGQVGLILLVMVGVYSLTFYHISPFKMKNHLRDLRRLETIGEVITEIDFYYRKNQTLPESLERIQQLMKKFGSTYAHLKRYLNSIHYTPLSNNTYKLCASFKENYKTAQRLTKYSDSRLPAEQYHDGSNCYTFRIHKEEEIAGKDKKITRYTTKLIAPHNKNLMLD